MVRSKGDLPYGSREYQLILPDNSCIARLRAHRNILFAATLTPSATVSGGVHLPDVGSPLVRAALVDAGSQGEQPQAMGALPGLCAWVSSCLPVLPRDEPNAAVKTSFPSGSTSSSMVLRELIREYDSGQGDARIALEAVRAIATGIPRPGHSVVGHGTFRDGEEAWKALAREFAPQSPEVQLYCREGAEVTGIELLLGDSATSPGYMKSAGGAMARMFFL